MELDRNSKCSIGIAMDKTQYRLKVKDIDKLKDLWLDQQGKSLFSYG